MKNRPPLSKVQLALLRSIDAASRMIGTPGIVPTCLVARISRHFFRADRAEGALKELCRSENICLLLRDRYRVTVAPPSWQDILLPGCEPEPLENDGLAAMIAELGIPTALLPSGHSIPQKRSVRKSTHWRDRFVLLANHFLAETWYGKLLPEPFFDGIMATRGFDQTFVREFRAELSLDLLIRAMRIGGERNRFDWGVTPFGIESIRSNDATPTLTPDAIAMIALPLGYHPLPRGDQLGR